MKNIMRRTVALMLMACLLLSVFPAVSLTADAASNSITYDFRSGDSTDYTSLTPGQTFHDGQDGSWAFAGANAGSATVYSQYGIVTKLGWSAQYFAVKLNNIPGPGTYDMTFTVLSNCTATATPYILAGDTDASALTGAQIIAGTPVGTVNPGNGENDVSTTLSVTITADKIKNGSVVLVFYANEQKSTWVRCKSLEITRTSWGYDFTPGDGVTVGTVDTETSYPKGIGSWTLLKTYSTASLTVDATNGDNLNSNAGGTTTAYKFVAVVLNGFPGAGTYDVTVTTPANNQTAMDLYLLPGDTDAGNLPANASGPAYIMDEDNGTYVGVVSENLATTTELSVTVDESDVVGGKIVLAFVGRGLTKPSTATRFRVSQVDFKAVAPKVAEAGGTQYTTVSEAITAAGTNGTVKLIASTAENVAVSGGVTLDLNGNTLTGNVVVSDGNIIDSATDSADATTLGGIVGTVEVETTNTYLPLKDGTTWRFFNYSLSTYPAYENTAKGTVEFWFDIDITNAAGYTLIKGGNSGLTVNAELSWTGASAAKTVSFAGVIAGDDSWANDELTEGEGQEAGMYLSVTGIPAEVTEVSVKPVYSSTAGLSGAFGDAVTYTVG